MKLDQCWWLPSKPYAQNPKIPEFTTPIELSHQLTNQSPLYTPKTISNLQSAISNLTSSPTNLPSTFQNNLQSLICNLQSKSRAFVKSLKNLLQTLNLFLREWILTSAESINPALTL